MIESSTRMQQVRMLATALGHTMTLDWLSFKKPLFTRTFMEFAATQCLRPLTEATLELVQFINEVRWMNCYSYTKSSFSGRHTSSFQTDSHYNQGQLVRFSDFQPVIWLTSVGHSARLDGILIWSSKAILMFIHSYVEGPRTGQNTVRACSGIH